MNSIIARRSIGSLTKSRAVSKNNNCLNLSFLRNSSPQSRHISTSRVRMGEIKTISTKNAFAPVGPYSQAKVVGSTIYVSGQVPATPEGNLVEGTIGERTAQCIKNIKGILDAAGASLEDVVKVNVFLTDMKNFKDMNEEYQKWFTTKPARSCVAVYQLPLGVEVEIECIASKE